MLTSANTDGIISLSNDIFVEGTVTFGSDVRLSASITIDTEQGADGAGSIVMTGVDISGTGAGLDLDLDASSNADGGQVVLGQFGNAGGNFVNDLSVNTSGSTAGNVSITTDISLDTNGADLGDLNVTGGGLVIVTGDATIDTENGGDSNAGFVNFGASTLTADAANDLTINTIGNTDSGTVTITGADSSGGAFIDDLTITTNSTNSATINLNGTVTTDGDQSYDSGLIDLPNVNVVSNNGSVTLSSNITSAANVVITAGLNINLNGVDIIDAGGQDVTLTATDFTATGSLTTQNVDDLGFNISGTANVNGAVSFNAVTLSTGVGSLNSNNNTVDLNITGAVDLDLDINTGGANFQVSGTSFDNTGGDVSTAGGEILVQTTGALTIGGDLNAGTGNVTFGEATSMTGGGTIFAATLTGLNATSNTFIINGAGGVGTLNTVAIDITNIVGGVNADTITINGGVLPGTINAGDGNDNITLQNGGQLTSNVINGEAGQDDLTIDFSGGTNVAPFDGLTFNGGDPTANPGDSLFLTNSGLFTSASFNFTNPSDGSITLTGTSTGTINYTGLEPVFALIGTQNINFEFNGGNETITVDDNGTSNDGLSSIDSDQGEQVIFQNPNQNLNIDANAGNDTINVNGSDTGLASDVTITGQNDLTVSDVNLQNSGVTIQSTGGSVTAGDITAGDVTTTAQDNLNAGNVNASGSVQQTSNTGSVTTGSVEADGSVTQTAQGSVNTGSVTAGNDVSQTANTGTVTTDDITATNGTVEITTSNQNINVGDVSSGAGQTIDTGGGSVSTGALTAGADATINSGGGSITTGDFSATDATVDSSGGTVSLDNVSADDFSIDGGGGTVSFEEIIATGDVSLVSAGGTINLEGDLISTLGALLIDAATFTTSGDATLTSTELTLDTAIDSQTNGIIDLDAGIVNFEKSFTISGGTSARTQEGGVEGKNVQLGAEVVIELPVIEVQVVEQPDVNTELIALLKQFGIELEGLEGISTKIIEPLSSERAQLGNLPTPLQTAQAMSALNETLSTTPAPEATEEFKQKLADASGKLMDSDDPIKALEELQNDEFVKNSPEAQTKLKALANLLDMSLEVEDSDDPDATFKTLREKSPWLKDAQNFLAQARALLIQKGKSPKFAAQLFMVKYAKPIQAAFPTTYGLLQQMAAE